MQKHQLESSITFLCAFRLSPERGRSNVARTHLYPSSEFSLLLAAHPLPFISNLESREESCHPLPWLPALPALLCSPRGCQPHNDTVSSVMPLPHCAERMPRPSQHWDPPCPQLSSNQCSNRWGAKHLGVPSRAQPSFVLVVSSPSLGCASWS